MQNSGAGVSQSFLFFANLILFYLTFYNHVVESFVGYAPCLPQTRDFLHQTPCLGLKSVASEEDDLLAEKKSKSPPCPFSMKYPRFRIPVSSSKDTSDSNRGGFFSAIKISIDRSKLEKKYAQDLAEGGFFWAEPSESYTKGDPDRTINGKHGIFASAFVWRKAADLLTAADQNRKRAVIALPKSSLVGLKQLADIINWLNDQEGAPFPDNGGRNLEATIDDNAPVPTIILSTNGEIEENRPFPQNDHLSFEDVQSATKSWVRRILVGLRICPFTKSDTKSGQGLGDLGVPVASIAYHHSKSGLKEIPLLMADTWEAIFHMIEAGPSGSNGVSSILLSAPEFNDHFSLWAGPIFAMLEQNVSAASAEPLIGVVCFHPKYMTPDGKSWPGFGHMHSVPRLRKWLNDSNETLSNQMSTEEVAAGGAYQRRTPYATINVLRAEQLEAAEGRRATSNLYSTNIKRLYEEGFEKLESSLDIDRIQKRI